MRVNNRHQALLICLSGLLIFTGCTAEPQRDVAEPAPPLVEAVQARFGALPIEEAVPGVVRARNQVRVRPQVEARVAEVLVQSGQSVSREQALVRLEDDELRERLRQAEATVRLAEASAVAARARVDELKARVVRSRALAAENLLSAQELEALEAQLIALRASADEAAARVEQAQATAEERRSGLAKTIVRSPVDGHVGERQVEVGMLVDPSTVLFVAGGLKDLIVEITLTEEMLSSMTPGLPVILEPRSGSTDPIRAELSRISPFLAAESFTTVGEIDLENSNEALRPGMFVNARVLVGESRDAVLIPIAAIWDDPDTGAHGVYVVEDGVGLEVPRDGSIVDVTEAHRVSFRYVEVLAAGRGVAGVTGVGRGAWVVTVGQHLLGSKSGSRASGGGAVEGAAARIRPVSWSHVLALQSLQDEDLLETFLEKQRTIAAALGAEIPASEDIVNEVLERAASERNDGSS